jgi:DNA-binding NarL/FixJ family response regulator
MRVLVVDKEPVARSALAEVLATRNDIETFDSADPFSWVTKMCSVVQRAEIPKGGHSAALEQPDLLGDDIRKCFAKVRARKDPPHV